MFQVRIWNKGEYTLKKIAVLKEEKGSSLIWVVIVMALLIGLGGSILLMSLGNLKMAKRVNESNKEYYDLEKEAETILKHIDKKLEEAEVATMQYMIFELYTRSSLNGVYLNYKQISQDSRELKLKIRDLTCGNIQSFFHEKWKRDIYNPSLINVREANGTVRHVLDEKRYNELLDSYLDDSFGKMYAYFAQYKLEEYLRDHNEGILDIRDNKVYYKESQTQYYLEDINGYKRYYSKSTLLGSNESYKKYLKSFRIDINSLMDFSNVSSASNWDKIVLNENIKILGSVSGLDNNHKLDLEAYITTPVYQARQQEKTLATKGNPIWTQAISADGDIKLLHSDSENYIYGDILGENIYFDDSPTKLYGNIYTSGNITLKGLNKIYVSNYINVTQRDYKLKIYENNKAFFKHIESDGDYVLMKGYKYLLDNDYMGGNIYCNKILLDKIDTSSSIYAQKYIWTKEDIDKNVLGLATDENNIYNLFKDDYTYKLNSGCKEGFKKAFNSKTKYFGTKNKTFDKLIDIGIARTLGEDKTGIKFVNAGGTFNIAGHKSGILLCDGDLNITGNGTFKGTIIVKGNITIDGDINFYYSEDVIGQLLQGKDVYGNNKNQEKANNIRKIFKMGEMGEDLFTEQKREIDSQTRDRITNDRYKIIKWKEGR